MKTKRVLIVSSAAAADEQTRSLILIKARDLFLMYGFSKVTVDEIASELAISKATLYRHFSSKEDILREVVRMKMKEVEAGVEIIITDEKRDFVQKLVDIMTYIGVEITKMGTILSQDIQKNAPGIWKEIEDFRRKKIMIKLKSLLDEGIQKGVFRSDFNQDLIVLMYTTLVQELINPATLIHYPLSYSDVFEMIITILMEGILTNKARPDFVSRRRLARVAKKKEKRP